jgi:tetratricopeptide (TPR) repeat protein
LRYLITIILFLSSNFVLANNLCKQLYETGNYSKALIQCEEELHALSSDDNGPLLLTIIDITNELGNREKQTFYLNALKNIPSFYSTPLYRFKWNSWNGIMSYYNEDLLSAEKYFFEELAIALLSNNEEWIAKSNNDLGVIAHAKMDFKTALEYYNKSLVGYIKIKDYYKSGAEYHNIGSIYLLLEDFENAHNYFSQALKSYTQHKNNTSNDIKVKKQIKHAYESLLRVSLKQDDIENADKYGAQVLLLESIKENSVDITHYILDFIRLYLSKDQPDLAKYFLNKALKINQEKGAGFNIDISYLTAKLYKKNNDKDSAIAELKSGLTKIESTNYIALSDYYLLLSDLYEFSNPAKSLVYLKNHHTQREKLLQQKFSSSIKAVQFEIETKKIENELNLERIERISSDLKIKTLNNNFLFLALLMIVLLTAFLSLYLEKKREKKLFINKVKQHKQQLIIMNEKTEQQEHEEIEKIDKVTFCKHLVKTMNNAVNIWEDHTGSNRVELADKSKIWTISIDDGTLRTRSLDKYLSFEKIPKNPRWRNVVRTCHFILSDSSIEKSHRNKLENDLSSLLKMVQNL